MKFLLTGSLLLTGYFLGGPPVSAQTTLGNFSGYTSDQQSLTLHADSSALRLVFYAPDILRVDLLPSRQSVMDSSFVVIRTPPGIIHFSVLDGDSSLTLSTSRLRVTCRKYPLRISLSDSSGRLLLSEPSAGGMSWNGDARSVTFALSAGDHFYGTGERGTSLDKRGQAFDSYNTQVGGYSTPLPTMNLNVPFLASTNGYALYIDNVTKGRFDLGSTDSDLFSYTAAGGELSLYLMAAPTIPAQLELYTWLTGRQPLPPRWALGYIQSKNRYQNEQEARSIVQIMRQKKIPCDAIVLDLGWFNAMGDVSWDEAHWPRHDEMVADFLSHGMKTILITEPYIIQPSRNFVEADTNGFLAKNSDGKSFLMDRWWSCGGGCRAALLDITDPDARQWWWSKHPAAFGTRVAGIWTDLGEPERHPAGMIHRLGKAEEIHNIYNLLWAKTIFEGFNTLRPGERVMNLTRSGFAGIQRYGVLPWSGDVARSFGGLAVQLPMLLNMGMSGLAYHNSDIGGYARMPTTPELYVRWMQYGTFCPIARAHGAGESVRGYPTEPWQFGPVAEAICRDFIRLRYRLLPYIYTLARANEQSGLPLARPLFWLDPGDRMLVNESSSYMWGDAFLVSPVVEAGQRTKDVYLPRGTWVDFWTDSVVSGGRRITVAAPLDRLPLFVKSGSIVPVGPELMYTDERVTDTLTLRVYPAPDRESSFTLYEDDGKTLDYQKGSFALTRFTHRWAREGKGSRIVLRAEPSHGQYSGQPKERVYTFEVHGMRRAPASVRTDGTILSLRGALHAPGTIGAGYSYDAAARILCVSVVSRPDQSHEILVEMPDSGR
jgi:alpha-glucosidase (family GH31 glycosyl hydrolase)